MAIPQRRKVKKLGRTKARKTTVKKGIPHPREGKEGDITIRQTENGNLLFIKAQNEWHNVKVSKVRGTPRASFKKSIIETGGGGGGGKPQEGFIGDPRVRKVGQPISPNAVFREEGKNTRNTTVGGSLNVIATNKIGLDGTGGHTYITETSNDILDIYVGSDNVMKIDEGSFNVSFPAGIRQVGAGHDGNLSRIHIVPSDFISDKTKGLVFDIASGGIKLGDATGTMYATVNIPMGFTATTVVIVGSVTTRDVFVYVADTDDATVSAEIGTNQMGSSVDINDTAATNTNFLIISIDLNSTAQIVYGGYVTISVT